MSLAFSSMVSEEPGAAGFVFSLDSALAFKDASSKTNSSVTFFIFYPLGVLCKLNGVMLSKFSIENKNSEEN